MLNFVGNPPERPKKKGVVVKSRDEIAKLCLEEPHIIISLYCTDDTPAEIPALGCTEGILRIMIDDIDDNHRKYINASERYTFFNHEHAIKIKEFLESFPDVYWIICQCDAGISRSSGLAAAISLFYNGDDREFFTGLRYHPNRLVYRTALNVLIPTTLPKNASSEASPQA